MAVQPTDVNRRPRGRALKKVTWSDRLRYRFDNTMARGPHALIGGLALVSAILVIGTALVVWLTNAAPGLGWPEVLWSILMQALAPNPVDPKAGPWTFLLAMLFITFGGIFMVSVLIGILTATIEHRIEDLRKGRSFVLERDHTLVLGWSSAIFTIISELVQSDLVERHAAIVILADKDQVEMEDEIRAKVPHPGRTRIVCRSGSPLEASDLEIVNPHTARSIIIVSPETEDPDTHVIKTMLALTNGPNRKFDNYHIVAEIHDPRNLQVARMVGREEAELVQVIDVVSRITVQTCRQSGLSVVYTDLLNFEGDDIYFKEEPALVGKTFAEILLLYEDSAVMGLQRKDGRTQLNPPMDTRVESGDQVIAVSEDEETIRLSGLTDWGIDESALAEYCPPDHAPERTLILGWNRHAPRIITELDNYVAPGSIICVVANNAEAEAQLAPYRAELKNETLGFQESETTARRTLDALDVPQYQHVVVLSDSDEFDQQEADAQTLITLLHLRDIRERSGKEFSIVSEMLDARNRDLAEVTRADDFIISDQLVSLMLSQISENKYLNALFGELFDAEGSEIYLEPAENFVRLARPLNFYTVLEAARRQNAVALGYRLQATADDAGKSYGVVINPLKSEKIEFASGDKIILLAERQ